MRWQQGQCNGQACPSSITQWLIPSQPIRVLLYTMYSLPQQNSSPVFDLAITPFILTLGLKVRGVLRNAGNSLSDRHQDFRIWAKGS